MRAGGIPFLMMIAPNKGRNLGNICRMHISGSGMETGPDSWEDYIQEHSDVTVLDPREYFNTNRDYVWYYKTDTHWNSAGGYIG